MSHLYPISLPVGIVYEFFDHFCGSASYAGNIGASNLGGSTANTANYSRMGVLAVSTGNTASTDQRGCISTSSSAFQLRNDIAYYLNCSLALHNASWYSAGDKGAARWGMANTTAPASVGGNPVEPTQGIYFRSKNSTTVEFVTIASGVETATTCGTLSNGVFDLYEMEIAADGSSAIAKINGSVVATHTTNIPLSNIRLNVLIHNIRTSASGVNYSIATDWLYFKATPNTPFF